MTSTTLQGSGVAETTTLYDVDHENSSFLISGFVLLRGVNTLLSVRIVVDTSRH